MQMQMLVLAVVWLIGGALVGALALAARRVPSVRRSRRGWSGAWTVGAGALAGLMGGWLGTLLLGTFFGSPTAAWMAVLVATCLPWMAARWPGRRAS
jgi:hypothetical protein